MRQLGRKPGKVLVLGAGTGNDVAVALAEGAERVDAVEIDPGILRIGQRGHPDRPYDSPKVRVFATDARSYLENTPERYDLIVFGTLDSMTRLSALSSVRLDNFVYTAQCLRAAHSRLTARGGVALYFMLEAQHIYRRLLATVGEAFESPPPWRGSPGSRPAAWSSSGRARPTPRTRWPSWSSATLAPSCSSCSGRTLPPAPCSEPAR